jgi:hypothetical protein
VFTWAFISAGCIYITATFLCAALPLLPSSGRRLHSYAQHPRPHIDRCYNHSKWPPFGLYFLLEPQAMRPSIHSWPCLGAPDGFPIDSIETLPIPAEFLASSLIFHSPPGPVRLRTGRPLGGVGGTRRRLCCVDPFIQRLIYPATKANSWHPAGTGPHSAQQAPIEWTGRGMSGAERAERAEPTGRKCGPLKIPRLRPDAVQNIRRFGRPQQQIGWLNGGAASSPAGVCVQMKSWPMKNCTQPVTRRAAGKSMNPLTPLEASCGDALVSASAHLRNTLSLIDLFSALTRPTPAASDASLNCLPPAGRSIRLRISPTEISVGAGVVSPACPVCSSPSAKSEFVPFWAPLLFLPVDRRRRIACLVFSSAALLVCHAFRPLLLLSID